MTGAGHGGRSDPLVALRPSIGARHRLSATNLGQVGGATAP